MIADNRFPPFSLCAQCIFTILFQWRILHGLLIILWPQLFCEKLVLNYMTAAWNDAEWRENRIWWHRTIGTEKTAVEKSCREAKTAIVSRAVVSFAVGRRTCSDYRPRWIHSSRLHVRGQVCWAAIADVMRLFRLWWGCNMHEHVFGPPWTSNSARANEAAPTSVERRHNVNFKNVESRFTRYFCTEGNSSVLPYSTNILLKILLAKCFIVKTIDDFRKFYAAFSKEIEYDR